MLLQKPYLRPYLRIAIVVGIVSVILLSVLALQNDNLSATAQNVSSPTPLLQDTPTPLLRGTATPQSRTTKPPLATANITVPTSAPTPTPLRTSIPIPTPAPSPAGEQYLINRSVLSEQLPDIALSIHRATRSNEQLILTVAFENRTDEALRFSFISTIEERRLQLIDGNGQTHAATAMDSQWAAIQPVGGFVAGGANVGTITFAQPIGAGPYQLVGIFDYPPLIFQLNEGTAAPAAVVVPNGRYTIETTLFSNDEVLEPLRLHIAAVTLTDKTLIFALEIINTHYLAYGLQRGPTGRDATLLNADRRQFAPVAISPSLTNGITPEDGILASETYTGTITFPRPSDLSEAYFVFTRYSPLHLRFEAAGLRENRLATRANGEQPISPTPRPDIARYNELTALLSDQATALLENDRQTFVEGLASTISPSIENAFGRLAQMPLAAIEFQFAPGQSFDDKNLDSVENMTVLLRYVFDEVTAENQFIHDFSVDFVNQPTGEDPAKWQIDQIRPLNALPFWWTDEVVSHETDHFLIFTRYDTTNAITTLGKEMETAYTIVSEQGLPLEERYVAYVTDPEEDFAAYTGATNPNVLGVTLSRYQINKAAINVVGRAFYINGSNFVRAEQLEERQSTITHELVHLALVRNARPFTPPWLSEGLAVYYAGQKTAADYDARYNGERVSTLDLSSLTRFSSLGVHDPAGETTSYRYLFSGAVIAYLVEQYGEASVMAFYRSYAQVPAAEIQDRLPLFSNQPTQDRVFQMMRSEITERALGDYFDLTVNTLDSAVKGWLQDDSRGSIP